MKRVSITPLVLMLLVGHTSLLSATDADTVSPNVTCYQIPAPRLHLTQQPNQLLNRMFLPAGTKLQAFEIQLSGPPASFAGEVVVYGHSKGLIAPRTDEPKLLGTLKKNRHGIENIRVKIDPEYTCEGGQIFIGVRDVPDFLHVLLVRDTTLMPCEDQAGSRQSVVYQYGQSDWLQTNLPLALGLVVEYPARVEGGFILDTTVDAAIGIKRNGKPYLSAGEINGDGLVDFAAAGLLYLSDVKGYVTLDLSTSDHRPYILFADVDGDGHDDLITMDLPCSPSIVAWRWHNGLLLQYYVVDFQVCLQPQSVVVLGTSKDPQLLISGIGESGGAVYSVSVGSRPSIRDVSVEFGCAGAEAPLLLAAELDGESGLEIIARTTAMDRLMHHVHRHEFVERSAVEFDNPAIIVSAASMHVDTSGHPLAELPRAVRWDLTDDRLSQSAPSAIEFKTNSVARPDERPASRQFVDLDNDGIAELVEFGHGACRQMVVFSQRNGDWVDVTYDLGLAGITGAEDGLIVDLDMDGRLDLVLDRRGCVEVRYNRLQAPAGRTLNLYGATSGTQVYQAGGRNLVCLTRGRGQLIEDAMQVHGLPVAADSIFSTRLIDDITVKARHRVDQNLSADLTRGVKIIADESGGDSPHLFFDGRQVRFLGTPNSTTAKLTVVTSGGATLVEQQWEAISDGSLFPLSDLLNEIGAASGVYSVKLSSSSAIESIIITYIH